MKRLCRGLAGLALFGLAAGGCAHAHEARADYHEGKARREAADGNFGKASKHAKKAADAREDAWDARH